MRIGERPDSKSGAPQGVEGSSPLPSAHENPLFSRDFVDSGIDLKVQKVSWNFLKLPCFSPRMGPQMGPQMGFRTKSTGDFPPVSPPPAAELPELPLHFFHCVIDLGKGSTAADHAPKVLLSRHFRIVHASSKHVTPRNRLTIDHSLAIQLCHGDKET